MEKQLKSLKIWSILCGIFYIVTGALFAIAGLALAFVGALPGVMILFIGVLYVLMRWRAKQFQKDRSEQKIADILFSIKATIIMQFVTMGLFFGVVIYTLFYVKQKLQEAVEALGVSEDLFDLIVDIAKQFL